MHHLRTQRSFAFILALCLLITMLPMHYAVEAEAVSGLNSLTCSGFISNSTARSYIDTMMRYYINNSTSLQNTLNNGLSVVFMFEGGSDNYWNGYTYGGYGTTRNQAVVIVVKLDSSGNVYIPYYCENCSSIPDDPTWCTYNVAHNGSTTLMDGIYSFYTWNHTGPYGAFQINVGQGYYTPTNYPNGQVLGASGINIHTRTTNTAYSGSGSWSAGCQVIGSGSGTGNEFNQFMKVVAGINFNVFIDYYNKTFNTISTGTTKGYYVVDRQLGMLGRDGTKFGSGSLINLYNQTALTNIAAGSTSKAQAAGALDFSYTSKCDYYPAYCQFKITESTPINSEPCSVGNNDSENLGTASVGTTYTALAMYRNTFGNFWYEIQTSSGETGYIYGGDTTYVKQLTSDIKLSSATAPNGLVKGSVFAVNGKISSSYNRLDTAAVWVHSGFGTSGSKVTGGTDSISGNSYTLANSTIDYATAFNEISTGKYTYAISANYTNYYAKDATTLGTNTGTVELMTEYFMVIPSSVSQSGCTHSYSTTVTKAATCSATGTQVKSCATCGKITEESIAKLDHSYGAWTTSKAPTCTAAGQQTSTCSNCGDVKTQSVAATGHKYAGKNVAATCADFAHVLYTCTACGDSYKEYDSTAWSTTKPTGVDESKIETRTQYRYSDKSTKTSSSATLDGYTLESSAWDSGTAGTVQYVESWPSGFSTSHSLYSTYNKTPKTASETANTKVTIDSSTVTGYLYYHWCWTDSYYSYATKGGNANCTTFHAFYSTKKPSECANYDSSDGSYLNPNTDCCTNGEWYWYTEVTTQKYTTYNKIYTHIKWSDWSDWSETPAAASATRKVESKTEYRVINGEKTDHTYVNGVCSVCGNGCDHSYTSVKTPATCKEYAKTTYTCSKCGHVYTESEGDMTEWSTTKPTGIDESKIETKTEYRYSDKSTKTSSSATLDGYTLESSAWDSGTAGTVQYVKSWPSGFSTSHSLYSTYNKTPKTASEIANTKVTIDSSTVTGYLYYHWCWTDSYYSYATKGGNANCTTFHAFYSTKKPSECANYDSSDGSYLNPNTDCCTNGEWYWYTEVTTQKYTTYNMIYTHAKWSDWSAWSTTPATASATRKVESQTLYRYLAGELGEHTYETVVTAPTCTTPGYTTYTCTSCGHTYTGDATSTTTHNYASTVTKNPTCEDTGVCTYSCSGCGASYTEPIAALGHSYINGVCENCGGSDPNYVCEYYLIGYINGADYGCEGDYANMGDYKFVDGKVTATFTEDSYVFIKTTGNAKWYMTNGWLGTETTTATLYNTASGLAEANKLYVPGGVELTFSLTVNADDTLTVSYTVADKPVIEKINVAFSQIDMGNTLGMRFAFPASTEIDWNGAYVVATMAGSTQTIPATEWESASIGGTNHYIFGFSNIAAKQMADEITIVIYNADGEAISNEYVDSIQAYVMRNVDKKDAESKALMVDMLNYGAAAQTYYGYNASDLANAQLTDAQKAYGTATMTEITDGRVKGANYLGTRLELGSSIGMQMNFAGTTADMYAVIEFTNHSDTKVSERVAPTEIDGAYLINITQIAVADGRMPITVTVYNADGTVYGSATDSMASYIARMSNADALYENIMKFSDSAFAYLH